MNRLTCLIVDDEPLAQNVLEKFCSRLPELTIIGILDNAIDAITIIKEKKPDIIFLDISMPELTGFEMLEVIGNPNLNVIITTAYPDFALEAFTFEVIDYLVKPIPFTKFALSVEKVKKRIGRVENVITNEENEKNYFLVKVNNKTVKVVYDDIVLISGMKDFIKLETASNFFVINTTLKKLEEKLESRGFIRVSKSFIIKRDAIESISGNEIILNHNKKAQIGKTYRSAVLEKLSEWML